MYRRIKSEAPRGDWWRMATEARRLTTPSINRPIKENTIPKAEEPQSNLLEGEQASLDKWITHKRYLTKTENRIPIK